MNPPYSMILFTVLAGAAQGLLLALFGVELAARGGFVGTIASPGDVLLAWGALVVVVLSVAGLVAATFHLGHPLRAWRAVAMWRTSWLSREVIVLPAFIASVAAWGLAHVMGAEPAALVAGCIALVLAVALYICTGMIYAAIVVIREWATPLTPLNFMLIGAASGSMLAAALAALLAPGIAMPLLRAGLLLTALAGLLRAATMWRNRHLTPRITLQSAIGVRHPAIRQTAQGFMGGAFNTHEFFHRRAAATIRAARWCAALLGCALPLLLAAAVGAWGLLGLWLVQLLGIAAERWLFFVDAQHPQNLYYQSMA